MVLFFHNLLALSLEAAPWLVLGLVLGGLMKALIPDSFLQRHLSGSDFPAIIKATLLGAPLPLCSCGVIPAALGLRQGGASKPATAAFLVATPETGIDSISVTYALMGPFMAIVRPVAAIVSALTAGLLVAKFDPQDSAGSQLAAAAQTGCCAEKSEPEPTSSCCSSQQPTEIAAKKPTLLSLGVDGIKYAFTNLLDDIILWLAVGMLFAAAAATFLPPAFLQQWGSGLLAMLVMLLAGIPMYICATASTPIAAGLMMAGVSPGVALVLLLTGPATNISTLGIISKELGHRSMWLYLGAVSLTAIVAGLITNLLVEFYGINLQAQLSHAHDTLPAWLQWASLALLAGMALRRLLPHPREEIGLQE